MDYNATTPMDTEVVEAVTVAIREAWGNPSCSYLPGACFSQNTVLTTFILRMAST